MILPCFVEHYTTFFTRCGLRLHYAEVNYCETAPHPSPLPEGERERTPPSP